MEDPVIDHNQEVLSDDEDVNPRPNRQRRVELEPYEEQLSLHPIFRSHLFDEISLATLESDGASQHRLTFKYIDVQIIRIITSSAAAANVYSRKRPNANQNTMKFSRLILAKVHSTINPSDNAKLIYIMEARNKNQNLWSKNVNLRDNGAVSIGAFIRIPSPLPIEAYMRCDIPLIVSHSPCILLTPPSTVSQISMNFAIESHTSLGFVYNNARVNVNYSSPIKTTCSGNFCDRQRISDWNNSRGCGCYGMSPNSTSLVFQHSISINTIDQTLKMDDFSSNKFSKLYLNGDIPGSVKIYMLQLTEAFINMYESMERCIDLINSNGGFTVVGWYKRGVINDKSLIATNSIANGTTNNTSFTNTDDVQVDSGDISYHIVNISPTNKNFLDSTSVLGGRLNALKFDVTSIETNNI